MFDHDPRWSSPTALYRYYTPQGLLLYVGISNQPDQRHAAHFKSSHWRVYASHRRLEWFPTRALAEWAEMQIVADEQPEFNSVRRDPISFGRLSDMWYLDGNGGKAEGVAKEWSQRPEAGSFWSGEFDKCDEPAWEPWPDDDD